jgi:preprotein translocase subunit SecD
MNVRDTVTKAPNWVLVVCGTLVALAIIAAITLLSATGSSSDDLIRLVNTAMNFLGILLGGGAWVTASAAAKSASAVEDKVNGVDPKDVSR